VTEHPRVARLDPHSVVEQIGDAGGPALGVVGPLRGGEVGAWLVRSADGHESVLTWAAARAHDSPTGLVDAIPVMDAARAAGVPVPRYEAIVELADGGVAVLQERVDGVPVTSVSDALVARLVELSEARHGLALRAGIVATPRPLYLTHDGPGFCLHAPLRGHSSATRALIERIERVGERGDALVGNDAVHFDYHLGNVLVAVDDPSRVTAIVDWGGASWCDIGLDLVILTFDLTRWAPRLAADVEAKLAARVDERRFTALWAHAALRLVDWTIRHHPDEVEHWVSVANRHL
jgi:Ser/Thr protein kinase RdoA (MazF antagonist)